MISARRPLPVGAADFKLLMAKRALKPFELTDSDVRQAVHAAPPGSLVFVLDHPELTGRCAMRAGAHRNPPRRRSSARCVPRGTGAARHLCPEREADATLPCVVQCLLPRHWCCAVGSRP
jgi:hypothetical protein